MKTQLTRRTFLKGSGTLLALPLLEAMLPRAGRAAAAAPGKRRLVCIATGLGLHTPFLNPEQAGRDYPLTPYLEPFAHLRDEFTIFSGLSHPLVDGGHSSESSFLTGAAHPGAVSFRNTISLDQFAIEKLQPDTRVPFLTLSQGGLGLSWTRSGVRIPTEERASALFAQLFLDGSESEKREQMQNIQDGRSIMDTSLDRAKRLQSRVGPRDRETLDQYFTSVRDVERRLGAAEAWAKRPKPKVDYAPPKDPTVPSDFITRHRLLLDMVRLALQTDSTRFATVFFNGSSVAPPIEGVTSDWHNLSHHGRNPEKISQLKIIELTDLHLIADFLTALKGTKEEGETLLDRTTVLYGSNLGNASSHDTRNLPMMLFGGGFKHGQHLQFDAEKNPPLANLHVSILQRLGIETDTFASGKGTLTGLQG